MRIAITGASGLIGTALTASLRADGHEVIALVRRTATGPAEITWNPVQGLPDADALRGVDAVVHLAGVGVGDRRWNGAHKRDVLESRVSGTATIAQAVVEAGVPVLISGSAIGYYGETGDAAVEESSGRGTGFLADVVAAWEDAAQPAIDAGVRVAFIRTGLVAAKQGGAFGRLLPLFKLGLGGPLGNGRQYWSAITLDDEVRAIRFLIDHALFGAFNLTAPTPVRNRDFTRALGRALGRPAILPVPAFVLRIVIGEFAGEILGSQRVLPKRLLESGFRFNHPDIEAITATLR